MCGEKYVSILNEMHRIHRGSCIQLILKIASVHYKLCIAGNEDSVPSWMETTEDC